jgi:CTP synthase
MKKPVRRSNTPSRSTASSRPAKKAPHKYIFVVGGVMSGVGKGIVTSSLGTLLTAHGHNVNLAKVDPYLNVDAGTMNPTEHGEVFVLNSGLETDQDMGNYERFMNRDLTEGDYMTSGMVYKHVIEKERALQYGGKCVEAIPHVRDEIIHRYEHSAKINKSEISIIEIGGTVGDYGNIMFLEAARTLKIRHPHDVIFIMVSYLPVPHKLGEMKTRPTQNAVHQLASYGITADIIVGRSEIPLDQKRKEKIANATNIPANRVISAPDIDSVYDVPGNLDRDHIAEMICEALSIPIKKRGPAVLADWKKMVRGIKNAKKEIVIGVVGKYFNTGDFILADSYLSVLEAIKYSANAVGVKPVIHTVNARDFEGKNADYASLEKFDGIIVPGGFGESGIEGKLNVIRYAREHKIPYFGLCYGMQLMTIEYARNVLGLKGAHTAEIDPKSPHVIIDIMPDQKKKVAEGDFGGSMRLGLYPAKLGKGTIAREAYEAAGAVSRDGTIQERHRHRYEVNPSYIARIEKGGLIFSGKSPNGTLMEIAELPYGTGKGQHPFFVGAQFHPEFLARPLKPHPLFTAFMKAAKTRNKKEEGGRKKQEKPMTANAGPISIEKELFAE